MDKLSGIDDTCMKEEWVEKTVSDTCYDTEYYCASGWNTYSGSGSSLKCYKSATQS